MLTDFSVGKREGKRPFAVSKHKWEDNFKTDVKEIGYENVGWIQLAHNRTHWLRLAKMAMKLWVPSNVGDYLAD